MSKEGCNWGHGLSLRAADKPCPQLQPSLLMSTSQFSISEGYGSCRKDVDCTEDPKNPYCSAFGFCIPNDSGTNGCKACKVLRRCMSRKGCW